MITTPLNFDPFVIDDPERSYKVETRETSIQYPCFESCKHIKECMLCSSMFKNDNTLFYIIIAFLIFFILCLIFFKKNN